MCLTYNRFTDFLYFALTDSCSAASWRVSGRWEAWDAAALGCPVSYHFPSTPLFSELREYSPPPFSTSTLFIIHNEMSPAAAVWHLWRREALACCWVVRLSGTDIWHVGWQFGLRMPLMFCLKCRSSNVCWCVGVCVCVWPLWSALSCAAAEQKDYSHSSDARLALN